MSNHRIVTISPQGTAPDDASRWAVVFPAYIDGTRTRAEGRRIPREAAAEEPNAWEMYEAATKHLGLAAALVDKAYPRSWYDRVVVQTSKGPVRAGCIRVKIKDEQESSAKTKDGTAIQNRKHLFRLVAALIPEIKAALLNAREKYIENNQTPKEKKKVQKKKKKKKKG